MAYLGRPSGGDSPFAIGDRAMKDTSSPQPPSQRNPTPRQNMPPQGFMATPSPFGNASDEGRRRYEERYAKKRAEEAAKAQQDNNPSPQPPQQQPPQQQGSYNQPQGGYGQHSQQQGGGYNGGGGPPPPRQQYTSPPPPSQQGGFDPRQIQHYPPPQQQQGGPPGHQQQQGQPGGYNQRPNSTGRPPQGYQSPPPPQHQQSQPPPQQQQRPISQQQQRWSQTPQGQQGGYNQPPPPPQQQQQWQQQHQQHPQQTQSPPPPQGADDVELQRMFAQFDSSRTGDLSAYDLQRLLAKDTMMDAREDAVKMLMNIFDTDRSGTINFMEFEGLYRYIQDWHGIFRRFDRDASGTIDRKELHNALLGFGFSLPKEMVIKLEKRFAPPPVSGQAPTRGISFDRFLMACVTVKHYTEGFRKLDANGQGHITVDYNQFMEMVLDSPS